jgi:hypothetical protein
MITDYRLSGYLPVAWTGGRKACQRLQQWMWHESRAGADRGRFSPVPVTAGITALFRVGALAVYRPAPPAPPATLSGQ